MSRFRELKNNMLYTYRNDGLLVTTDKLRMHARSLTSKYTSKQGDDFNVFTDVLFINGCAYSVPHPVRYRVDHQIEQLESRGVSARKIDAWNLDLDHVRTAKTFIIFRCPYSENIGEFISLAHMLNKTVLFDIDDLVFDTKYTDNIDFLNTLSKEDRRNYDNGVMQMQKTMLLCDGAITSTKSLANELRKYIPNVIVNENVASELMLLLSQEAIRTRDVLPNLPIEAVPLRERKRRRLSIKREGDEKSNISIGYFSGSITHNDDFLMILPAIKEVLESYNNVYLHLVGEIDVPDSLEAFHERIIFHPFMPWTWLPMLISEMDINIVPLEDTIFNRAKSANKWLEASLVKVPTIASNVGTLSDSIDNEITGILCGDVDEWKCAIERLINNPSFRSNLAQRAYEECMSRHTTLTSGKELSEFVANASNSSIAFLMTNLSICGGNLVTSKHASLLSQAGIDVSLITDEGEERWLEKDGVTIPVICRNSEAAHRGDIDNCIIRGYFDRIVATFWETCSFAEKYPFAKKKMYLVQSYEADFFPLTTPARLLANSTYGINKEFKYLTISKWCKQWLSEKFNKDAAYIPNGIDTELFFPTQRDFSGKIRILIEGDSAYDYKNVDESFEIINGLDEDKYEIWYMSYNGKAKPFYRVDKSFNKVPYEDVPDIYRQCHILLKTSILESFSYPPLEMMSTGGFVVVLENPGTLEYAVDGYNCLMFKHGEIQTARNMIESICNDTKLREALYQGGIETAEARKWSVLSSTIVKAYE